MGLKSLTDLLAVPSPGQTAPSQRPQLQSRRGRAVAATGSLHTGPTRPDPSGHRSGGRAAYLEIIADIRFLEVKQEIGERLTASELARLEAARAASAQPAADDEQPEGGNPP